MNKHIVLLGAPGSGKGTQGDLLTSKFGIFALSTGEAFRLMIKEGTGETAERVRTCIGHGQLVSDELTFSVVTESLDNRKDQPWLLDGYPRNLHQAELLQAYCQLTDVAFLDINEDELLKRLVGRRVAKESGKIYNIYFNPPKKDGFCDVSGEPLIQRDDDKPETVAKRMVIYHEQTKPLVNYYEGKGLLRRVKADGSVDEVFTHLVRALGL